MFSLHAQGWPYLQLKISLHESVLPARAGMARYMSGAQVDSAGSPCTRRDGPLMDSGPAGRRRFSLHAQGWPGL